MIIGGTSVSLGSTKKVAVIEGVLLGVLLATCATIVGRGVFETNGVGLGVRVGAIVGVTSGTDKLQAASSKASRITLRRIIIFPQIIPLFSYDFASRNGRRLAR